MLSDKYTYWTTASGSVISVHASTARFHKGLVDRVLRSPTIINANLALVHITFNRLGSSRKPRSPSTLHRTVEKTIISLSRPWNESIVEHVMDLWRSALICFVYGDRTVVFSSTSLGSSCESGFWVVRRGKRRRITSTWPWLLLDRSPISSSSPHWMKTIGTTPPFLTGQGNVDDDRKFETWALPSWVLRRLS